MTLPAMWIRKNMLQSPSPPVCTNNNGRTLTEAELKVQRSLQKLSIPDWYLNNNSRPPKILTNDTPIELRPAQWKEQPLDKNLDCSTPVMPSRNLTINRNGVLETEIGPSQTQIYGTYKKPQRSTREKSPTAKKPATSSQKNQLSEKKPSRTRLANISRTFPRVSPCRKIQNINIVFPPTEDESLSHLAEKIDSEASQADMTKDSLEVTSPSEVSDLERTSLQDESVVSNASESRVSRMPDQRLTYIKPWKPQVACITPDGKSSIGRNFKLRASSTPQQSPVPKFTSDEIADEREMPSPISLSRSPEAMKPMRKTPPPVAPRTIKLVPAEEEICDACKADASRRASPSPNKRTSGGLRPRNLYAINEKTPQTPRLRALMTPTAADSPTIAFFTSKKKSSQLENIVKKKQPQRGAKSLVQEIIEELNEKCRSSAQPTYVTPGSKNFVKKLVKALEKGTPPRPFEEEPEEPRCERMLEYTEEDIDEVEIESSEHGSEDDAKSAAASTSISYKDTDSSDSELRSPTVTQDYRYDWNMNVEKGNNETVTLDSKVKPKEREEESVYWIPVQKSTLPRTSSMMSVLSRFSTESPAQEQSPGVSPIKRNNNEGKKCQGWGMTFKTSDYMRTLRRIDETTVLDSGYSDRSRGHSSASSNDNSFDETEGTRTASEVESLRSYVGRPFVV